MALAATVYMCLLGKGGIRKVADLSFQKAHHAAQKLDSIPGYSVIGNHSFFNEFILKCPEPVELINEHLLDHGILGGFDLGCEYPSLANHMLIALTEMNHKDEIDALCNILQEVHND
jgi:glycine dehydrogenase subunit 1